MREEEGWGEMRGSIDREKEKNREREREREENCACVCVCVCVCVCGIEERKLITQVMREARESC